MTRYLLDANVFIQAKNLHYGFDFCPAFWQWLVAQHASGIVASVEKVADELRAGDDELKIWAEERGSPFFITPDELVVAALPAVSSWATGKHYEPACVALGLTSVTPYEMLRRERARFVLGPASDVRTGTL